MTRTLPDTIQQKINHIQNDTTSGSTELATQAAHLLINLVNIHNSPAHIKNAAIKLVHAQPTMAAIINLTNQLIITLDQNPNQQPNQIVTNLCEQFLNNLNSADTQIAQHTQNLIQNDTNIITYSYSSTVLHTLLNTKNQGKHFSVICTESRPKNEGLHLAQQLAKNHIPTTLIIDAAVFSFIPKADIIILGADAVTNSGLINKIGTHGIATTAHQHNTPIYSLCSTIKFLPSNYTLHLNQKKNPKEIIPKYIPNITPLNLYFDLTPLELFTGIITEKNILIPTKIKEHLQPLKIHESLAKKTNKT